MPNLEGQNLTFAIGTLLRNHLKLGDTTFRPDFAVGSVLEQQYNGVRIPAKSKIQWGSKIDLVIAGGLEDREIPVPSLTGLSYAEAKSLLESEGITLGAIISDGRIIDTSNAFIIKQRPDRFDVDRRLMYIRSGQLMDVWISQEMKTLASDSIAKMKNKEQ
jgi:beta-lactam-binding protein with PASTA domain